MHEHDPRGWSVILLAAAYLVFVYLMCRDSR